MPSSPRAGHVTKLDLVNNRLVPNPIEPRVAIGSYNRANDEYTLYVANQNPHVERLLMTAFVLGLPEHKVVIAPDVGGGFGSKIFLYAEDVALTWAAKQLNRSIKWTGERSECLPVRRPWPRPREPRGDGDGQGRQVPALRVHTDANLGAYLSTFSTAVPTILYATLLAGQYTTPQIYVEVDAWFTNTAPVDAYGGAGRPEATYLLEPGLALRLGDESRPGRDPQAQLHHRVPYQTPAHCSTTRATSTPPWTRRRNWPRWQASRSARRRARPGQAAGHRLFQLHRGLRHRAIQHRGCARRARACSSAARSACTRPAA